MWSLLDKDMKRQKGGERGEGKREGGSSESKTGSLDKVPSWPPSLGSGPELGPCLAWVRRMQKAAAKDARFGAHFTQIGTFPAYTIQAARNQIQLSPDLQPLAAFISRSLPSPLVYVFVSSHVLANVTNAAPAPGYR